MPKVAGHLVVAPALLLRLFFYFIGNGERHVLLREEPRYLSDADWSRLCGLLDEVCNGFCASLRERWPDLTLAELRTAVLMRFRFSGQEMATMMGISPASVTKSKQRLKARLGPSEFAALS